MTPLLRSAALAAMLSATLSIGLVAQSNTRAPSTNPACALLTDQELDTATGLDYGPGGAYDRMGQGVFGGATCLWDAVWNADMAKSLPQIGVVFIPPGRTEATPSCTAGASRRRAAPAKHCAASATSPSRTPARAPVPACAST